jgi:hypothetical protein
MKLLYWILSLGIALGWYACTKDTLNESDRYQVKGKVIHQDSRQPVSDIWVYTDYGKPCCGGIEQRLGIDSARTNNAGEYQMTVSYPDDSLIYRFITYIKGMSIAQKYYPYNGPAAQAVGIGEFEYNQMVAPVELKKLPDGHVQTCDFAVLPIGFIQVKINRVSELKSLELILKRMDSGQEMSRYTILTKGNPSNFTIPALAGVPMELRREVEFEDGRKETKINQYALAQGQSSILTLDY